MFIAIAGTEQLDYNIYIEPNKCSFDFIISSLSVFVNSLSYLKQPYLDCIVNQKIAVCVIHLLWMKVQHRFFIGVYGAVSRKSGMRPWYFAFEARLYICNVLQSGLCYYSEIVTENVAFMWAF